MLSYVTHGMGQPECLVCGERSWGEPWCSEECAEIWKQENP